MKYGRPIDRAWLTWDEISNGGVIRFELDSVPCESWGRELPPSLTE